MPRKHEHVARLGLADFLQPEPCGEARHPEDAEVVRPGHARGVHLVDLARLRNAHELPSERREHLVAGLEGGVLRFDDLADRLPVITSPSSTCFA
jgi:hypothetical protein